MIKAGLLYSTALVTALVAAPAFAQDPAELDEVVVTGVRASLAKSLQIKRDQVQIVDSTVAEDTFSVGLRYSMY